METGAISKCIKGKHSEFSSNNLKSRILKDLIIYRLVDEDFGFCRKQDDFLLFPGPWARIFRNLSNKGIPLIDKHLEQFPHFKDPISDGLFVDRNQTSLHLLFGFYDYQHLTDFDSSDLNRAFEHGMRIQMLHVKEAVMGRSRKQLVFKSTDIIEMEDITDDVKNMLML